MQEPPRDAFVEASFKSLESMLRQVKRHSMGNLCQTRWLDGLMCRPKWILKGCLTIWLANSKVMFQNVPNLSQHQLKKKHVGLGLEGWREAWPREPIKIGGMQGDYRYHPFPSVNHKIGFNMHNLLTHLILTFSIMLGTAWDPVPFVKCIAHPKQTTCWNRYLGIPGKGNIFDELTWSIDCEGYQI